MSEHQNAESRRKVHKMDLVDLTKYQALVFDFDMTLADTARVIVDLLDKTAQHFGYAAVSYEEARLAVGNTHKNMLKMVTGEQQDEKLLIMQEHYRRLCREEMAGRTELFPGVLSGIRGLYLQGKKLGVLSQKLKDVLVASLAHCGLLEYFTCVLGVEDVARAKPAPDGLLTAAERLGVCPTDILYIGDSLVDEGTAEAAGVDFAPMLLGGTRREEFQKKHVGMFSSWEELNRCVLL